MKHKKIMISSTIFIGIVGFAVLLFTPAFHQSDPDIIFLVNHSKVKQMKETVKFGDKISLEPKAFGLTAKADKKDVTKKLTYTKVNFRQLRTYKITYEYGNAKFYRYITVKDKTAPVITGKESLEIEQGSSFDVKQLDLKAEDNYDGNLSDQLKQEGSVQTDSPGAYELTFTVQDSSGNKTAFQATVHVLKKETAKAPPNQVRVVTNPNDVTVLVNKQNILPDGWAPSDLVYIQNGFMLRSEAAQAWNAMMQAAAQDGITINAVSAYRTQAYQTNLYNQYYAQDPINTPFLSALPRRSEHEMGLALDVSYGDYQLHSDLESTATGKWLAAHAQDYGWILRYPSNKTSITQYAYEAWHYRYVGTNLARQLKSSSQTLDEYYQ